MSPFKSSLTLALLLTLLNTTFAVHLQPRKDPTPIGPNGKPCTAATCPPSESIYGYAPSLGANAFFAAFFAATTLVQIWLGLRWRSWSFGACMALGSFGEAVGYGARTKLHSDWFNTASFTAQLICLTVSPVFLAAAIYLTLKHTVIVFGAHFSRLRPAFYTWLFVGADVVAILVQVMGATIAAGGGSGAKTGNSIMLVGLSFQVGSLVLFGAMAAEYAARVWRHRYELNEATSALRKRLYFRACVGAITLAYLCILIRCAYRVAEMAGGWESTAMRNEGLFIGMDSAMCTIALLALNVFHPGFMFRESARVAKSTNTDGSPKAQEITVRIDGSAVEMQ